MLNLFILFHGYFCHHHVSNLATRVQHVSNVNQLFAFQI